MNISGIRAAGVGALRTTTNYLSLDDVELTKLVYGCEVALEFAELPQVC